MTGKVFKTVEKLAMIFGLEEKTGGITFCKHNSTEASSPSTGTKIWCTTSARSSSHHPAAECCDREVT